MAGSTRRIFLLTLQLNDTVKINQPRRFMKLKMTIDEALNFADTWSRGMTVHEDSKGWRVVCMLLAEEVRRLRRGDVSNETH